MRTKNKILIPVLLAVAFALLVSTTGAQEFPGLTSSGIILDISPEHPKPDKKVRIKARAFDFDTSRASFRWFVEGELFESGTGKNTINVTAGPVGSVLNIRVAATTREGATFESRADIDITDVDFVINPLTYTPYFYRGSALPTPGSKVEIIAVPFLYFEGSRLDPASLVYDWSIGGQRAKSQSGQGKNKLVLSLFDAVSNYEVSVKISSRSDIVRSSGKISFSVYRPEALFYRFNNLTGFWNYSGNSFTAEPDSTVSVSAEPYYFDLSSLNTAVLEWSAERTKIEPGEENPRLLSVTIPPETVGRSNFSFKLEKPRSIFQRAENNLTIDIFEEGN